jgi:hypothetical protein
MEGALNSNSGTVSTVIQRIVENATAGASFTSSAQPGPYVPEALGGPTSTGNAYLGVSTSGPSTIALPYQIYTGTPDFPLPSSPYLAVGAWTDVVTGTQVGNGVSVFGEATVSAASTTVEWPPTGLGNSSTDLEADSGADFDNSGGAELVNVTNQVAALSQVTFNC